ncbi:Short chain dehydrogenase yanD [Fusarium oxysporum f. sp. albedinis]|nr:Short chain dehydrogenase yanD [Fusarium oxysporum f. sp. albedinis]
MLRPLLMVFSSAHLMLIVSSFYLECRTQPTPPRIPGGSLHAGGLRDGLASWEALVRPASQCDTARR